MNGSHMRIWMLLIAITLSTGLGATEIGDVQRATNEYRQAHERIILDEFIELLAIPNVASDDINIRRNAELIREMYEARGVDVELLEIDGAPPAIYGELSTEGAETTILIYAHYDGQPVQADHWNSDPWTPVVRDNTVENGGIVMDLDDEDKPLDPDWRVFARSASDDKAPIIALAHALDALGASGIDRSVNLKFFFEGEEEAGSPNLVAFLSKYKDKLGADLWLFCDGPVHQTGRNQLVFGVRGTTSFDLTVYGPRRPLHSGHYGNWAPNPIAMLSDLLASMRTSDGLIAIEGINELVEKPSASELAAIEEAPSVDERLKRELGIARTEGGGERLERLIMNPALNYKGIQAGGVGAQARNIIVTQATASVGVRLVPNLTPHNIQEPIEQHLREQGYTVVHAPPDDAVRAQQEKIVLVSWHEDGYPAFRTPMHSVEAETLTVIMDEITDGELVRMPTMGGSLPLSLIEKHLEVPIVILPIANHDNNQHGENENIRIGNLWKAIEINAAVIATFGDRITGIND